MGLTDCVYVPRKRISSYLTLSIRKCFPINDDLLVNINTLVEELRSNDQQIKCNKCPQQAKEIVLDTVVKNCSRMKKQD